MPKATGRASGRTSDGATDGATGRPIGGPTGEASGDPALGEPLAPFPWREFTAPRHWPTWLGFGVFAILARLPFDTQLAIGRGLGTALHRLLPSRRRIARVNVGLAFPERSDVERADIVRESFRASGAAVVETACVWFRPQAFYADRVAIDGGERVDAALATGRGVIVLQAHFTAIDICAPAIASRWHMGAVQDAPKNPLYAAFLAWQRAHYIRPLVDNRDIRSMVRLLRGGGGIWYSPDQSVTARHGGIPTRYFGQPVLTTAGTARMAAMTGAAVIPHMPVRDPATNRYTLRFLPPVELPRNDIPAATQAINDLLEAQVREQPGQYLWAHRRFKPPTSTTPDPYRKEA